MLLLKSASLNLKGDEMSEDYTFHYKLDLEPEEGKAYQHRLPELARTILENFLNIIVPLKSGKEVKIDSFRWLRDREESYPIFSEASDLSLPLSSIKGDQRIGLSRDDEKQKGTFRDTKNAAFYEPRIDFIKSLIGALLSLIELEKDGQVVKADGFRLKNLQDWIVPSSGDPSEILEYAGSHCNCDCVFCYNKGSPPPLAPSNNLKRTTEEEFEEIKTRIRHFLPKASSGLFFSLGDIYEVMMHPYFMEVIHLLREKTSNPLKITTNGRNLTPEVIAELAKIKPIYLYLSLNSSSPSRRQRIMRDPEPEIAINALPLLRQQGIPYTVVIVPWPVETIGEMLEDLSSTVVYATEHEAHLIEINLPGYTKYFSATKLFNLNQLWKAVISQVRELREKYDYPIVAMPTLYEENIYESRKNMPRIIGLVKNSPAHLAGLKRGDIIRRINSLPIRNRPQARDLLFTLHQSEINEATLTVQRDSQTIEASLDLTKYSYPYSKEIDTHLGIIFMGTGFRESYLERLREIIQTYQAKRILFLSSALVKPTFEQCLTESHLFGNSEVKIDIEIPKNNFFGGNIFMGDLLVVQDFIDCVKEYTIQKEYKPDLVIIPSSPFNLGGWGRDLTGRVYLDIERETGIPVELLHCATIHD